MATSKPPRERRTYSSGERTRELLIDTAERLFAARGIEAVSLREIGEAAGLLNTASVKYHFGDKNGLLQAIFIDRSRMVHASRMAILKQKRRVTTRQVARALMLPFVEAILQGSAYPEYLRRLVTEYRPGFYLPWIETEPPTTSWLVMIERWIGAEPSMSRTDAHARLSVALNAGLACLSGRQISTLPTQALDIGTSLLPLEQVCQITLDAVTRVLTSSLAQPTAPTADGRAGKDDVRLLLAREIK